MLAVKLEGFLGGLCFRLGHLFLVGDVVLKVATDIIEVHRLVAEQATEGIP